MSALPAVLSLLPQILTYLIIVQVISCPFMNSDLSPILEFVFPLVSLNSFFYFIPSAILFLGIEYFFFFFLVNHLDSLCNEVGINKCIGLLIYPACINKM